MNRSPGASLTGEESNRGLWPSPWPAEDGGPARRQQPHGIGGLGIGPGERLRTTAVRDAFATTMVVLREPGELYALRHSFGRRPLDDPAHAWVERLDPLTLEPLARSPDLPPGPFWPGGLAVHANGSLHVVFGDHCHRLSADLEALASTRLPADRPYNSFVVLADGTIVTKDFDRALRASARLTLLDPDTLERRCGDVEIGEPAIARLSADGDRVYVVGARSVMRFAWDGARLELDRDWGGPYLSAGGSYGWDPVLAGGSLWFMDNGAHDFVTTMRGAGVAPGPVHLVRISLEDDADLERVEISGAPRGAITNPPLYDPERRIAIAHDSANGVVQAFSFDGRLEPLWRREISQAAHMILFPESGELVLHDFHGPALARTRAARAIMRRTAGSLRHAGARRLATRASGDDVVVVDIETGTERSRTHVPSVMQSVLFGAPGFERDLYWVTMTTIARLVVE